MKNILMIMTAAAIGGLISNMIRAEIEQIKIKRLADTLMDAFIEVHNKKLEEERHKMFKLTTDEIRQHIEETENEFRRFKENA